MLLLPKLITQCVPEIETIEVQPPRASALLLKASAHRFKPRTRLFLSCNSSMQTPPPKKKEEEEESGRGGVAEINTPEETTLLHKNILVHFSSGLQIHIAIKTGSNMLNKYKQGRDATRLQKEVCLDWVLLDTLY